MPTGDEQLTSPSAVQRLRSWIYDTVIVSMTQRWYREVLTRLPMDAHVLDVGIGTATSLLANRDLIRSKRLTVCGVDYDGHYIAMARDNTARLGMSDVVTLVHSSIHEFTSESSEPYDVVYFSGSFMIIPDKAKALKRCAAMALRADTGRFYFTQTFEREGFMGRWVTPWVKLGLKMLLTIDFGTVTFEKDFLKVLREADVEVVEMITMHESPFRNQVLVVAKPIVKA